MGDALRGIENFIAPQPGVGGMPMPGAAPVDRWLPLLMGASGALSTPSAGGAGPIIGAGLGGFGQGRMIEQQNAQNYAAKQAAAQAAAERYKAAQAHWNEQATSQQAHWGAEAERYKAGQASADKRAELGYKGRVEAAGITAAGKGQRTSKESEALLNHEVEGFMRDYENDTRVQKGMPNSQSVNDWLLDRGQRSLALHAGRAHVSPDEFASAAQLKPLPKAGDKTGQSTGPDADLQGLVQSIDPSVRADALDAMQAVTKQLEAGQPPSDEDITRLHAWLGDDGLTKLMNILNKHLDANTPPTAAPK